MAATSTRGRCGVPRVSASAFMLALSAYTCAAQSSTSCLQRGCDGARSDVFPGAPSLAYAAAAWSSGSVSNQVLSTPVHVTAEDVPSAPAGGLLIFGATDFKVHALDAATGAEVWALTVGHEVNAPVAVAMHVDPSPGSTAPPSARVYAGSQDMNLYAIDAATGTQVWRAPLNAADTRSGPVVVHSERIITVGTIGASIRAYDEDTGALVWTYATSVTNYPNVEATGLLSPDGTIVYYAATSAGSAGQAEWRNSAIYALRTTRATLADADRAVWTVAGAMGAIALKLARSADGSRLFFVARSETVALSSAVYCVDTGTGAVVWTVTLPIFAGPAAVVSDPVSGAATRLYIHADTFVSTVDAQLTVVALSAVDGSTLWTHVRASKWNQAVYDNNPIVAADGTVYVGSSSGVISALSPVDGTMLWEVGTTDDFYRVPVTAAPVLEAGSGALFVAHADFHIRRFDETAASASATPSPQSGGGTRGGSGSGSGGSGGGNGSGSGGTASNTASNNGAAVAMSAGTATLALAAALAVTEWARVQ
jgi:outer membrane protein assembly factor BamB